MLGLPVRLIGPLAIGTFAVAFGALWLLMRPPGEPLAYHPGQLSSGESILLMSFALVLISTLPQGEQMFGGIDYAAIWHRRPAIAGTLLLLPHTEAGGRLSPQQVLDTAGGDPAGLSVFMGGPDRMLGQFRPALRASGVPAADIHREYFHWR